MNLCKEIERITGLSGHALSIRLNVLPTQWYRWRESADPALKISQQADLIELIGAKTWCDLVRKCKKKGRAG